MEYRSNQLIEYRKVAVVRAESPRKLPHALNGVEIGTVGRQEVQTYDILMGFKPWAEVLGVVPTGVVDDDDHPAVPTATADELFEKRQKRCRLKLLLSPYCQSSVPGTNRAKHADTLACWSMKHDRVCFLRRNPHDAT